MGTTVTDPLVGRLVDGRYEVVSRIARGGMATVYLAIDRRLEREVALKVMHPHLAEGASGSDFIARFRREARTAARLTHPGLVSVFDQGVDGETSYLTMEYVDGTTLRRRIGEQGALRVGESLRIIESVLDALTAAHRAGLVHRDIKPENVLLDADERVKLADFGLARAVTEVTSTTTGTVLGTVAYLAPELVARGVADARTDVYATGILLFEMITGRQPFTGETPIQVAFQHVNMDIPEPSELVAWLPSEVDELVGALAARDPADRPLDAGAALVLVRRTRHALDEATLERRADVAPTMPLPEATAERPDDAPDLPASDLDDLDPDDRPTTLLGVRGTTVALPIGAGLPAAAGPAPKRRHRLRTVLVLVALLAAAGAFWGWYATAGPGRYTSVPAITSLSAADAARLLEAEGLVGDPREAYDDQAPVGTVFASDPMVGERIEKGGTVAYTVSLGVDLVTLPAKFVGLLQADAEAALVAADVRVEYGDKVYDDTAAVGQVMTATLPDGSEAKPGAQVKRGTVVTLALSQGPAPALVLQVTGMTVDEANAQLAANLMSVVVGEERFSDTVAAGRIIEQTPKSGESGHRGDTITVVVSKGPEMIGVPYLRDVKADKAQSTLVGLGFQVKVVYPFGVHVNNRVIDQEPPGGDGKTAPKGSQITLYVF